MKTFSETLSTLTVVDGQVLCQDGTLFDRVAYSHFKYGFLPPSVQYGQRLAALIADQLFEVAGNEPITIVSAPYKHLPTASHAVAQVIVDELSRVAMQSGRALPVLVPFHKSRVGSSNYAKSDEAYRRKSLATLGLHIDESKVCGAHVVVVDDIRITGSAEKATAQYLESLQPASIWYLHAARLDEATGKAYPGLEDELNQTVAHTLEVILGQVAEGTFQLNTECYACSLKQRTRTRSIVSCSKPRLRCWNPSIRQRSATDRTTTPSIVRISSWSCTRSHCTMHRRSTADAPPTEKRNYMYTIPKQVTALSFDIWKTLLGGNKAFTTIRLQTIFDRLEIPIVDIDHVREAYKRADKFYNDEAEHTMTDYGMAERLQIMFALLGIDQAVPSVATISSIQAEIGVLRSLPQYMPPLLEPDLRQTLQALKDQGFTLGLLSNTGMDDIQVMEPVLKTLELWDLFQVRIFSSEDGRAKPHPDLFRRMARELKAAPNQVLHIGDNRNADYRAITAGLHAVVYEPKGSSSYPHITSMHQLLKDNEEG